MTEIYIRNCPKCNKILKCKTKSYHEKSLVDNRSCISCARKGIKFTKEHRKNISKAVKGQIKGPHSQKTKDKIGKKAKQRWSNPEYKKHMKMTLKESFKNRPPQTEASKSKRSEFMKGHVFSKEHNKKISEARKGMKFTQEHKNNISKGKKGKKQSIEMVNNRFSAQVGVKYDCEKSRANLTERERYNKLVSVITCAQPIHTLKNYDKLRGKSGVLGAYQLDHIVSKDHGFRNNIKPEIIGNISNLQFITWEKNLKKGAK